MGIYIGKKLETILMTLKNKVLYIVCMLLLLGLVMPLIIDLSALPIYEYLYQCVEESHQGILLIASAMLVLMNSLRILPIYMAVFALLEVVMENMKSKKLLYTLLVVLIVPLVYKTIYYIYGIKYHFGMPSIIIIISMVFYASSETIHISIVKKTLYIAILLIGIQWLDITPMLSNFGFGYGEISQDIKNISLIIDATEVMNFFSLLMFMIFTLNSFMVFGIFSVQNKALIDIDIKREMRKELNEARLNSIKTRSTEETQNLVHDLKTPLTIIEMYAALIEMIDENNQNNEYVEKIISSVDQLDKMISEILQEDKRNTITVDELFRSVLSQISTYDLMENLTVQIECPDTLICINKIRISRAIINIVKNSIDSMDNINKMKIDIDVTEGLGVVKISIIDNGKGIEPKVLEKIFDRGFSTKESSGIGLAFVKTVVENHDGSIKMFSKEGIGTEVVLEIPHEYRN